MRSLSANALTKIQTALGTEPVNVIEVNWGTDDASEFYADKAIPSSNVTGRVLEVSGLDEAVQVSGGAQSTQISVKLSDHDGHLKAIFDAQDVHKKTVKVWQWFTGLDFADKFLVFAGQINSPVIWSEGERTLSFAVVNRIEDVEVGFSAEEGEFTQLPEDLIGKPWPLCFGTCVNVPALKAVPAVSGTLAHGVGIRDFTLERRLQLAQAIVCPRMPVGFRCGGSPGFGQTQCNIAYEDDLGCVQAKCVEVERLRFQLEEQASYEYPTLTIFGGRNFPQGVNITLNIGGGLFNGKFSGTVHAPSDTFVVTWRRHPLNDGMGGVIRPPEQLAIETACEGESDVIGGVSGATGSQDENFVDSAFGPLYTGVRDSRVSWENYRKADGADFFWAGGGTAVTMEGGNEITYIANILSSVILRVSAYRTINGNRQLLTVPSDFYEIRQTNYGGYTGVMEIVFDRPLSRENQDSGGGWEDDIYVSLTSSIGPNTVDILEWFIETYSQHAIDATSFDATRTLIDNYPMHFPLLVRKNLLTVLQEIAKQARCVLWLASGTFKIKYLPAVPTPVATIAESDIIRDLQSDASLEIELTKTEDLVTKYTSKWRVDHALPKDNTLILRHNLNKYGTHERTDDYYTFNILDLVRKSSTFWLIRYANTWKRVKFSTSLKYLNLEANDAVTLQLPDVATGDFLGIIEKAVYDSDNNRIDFEVWTPVRAGETTPYLFAFPAAISEQALFPTIEDRSAGRAGSGTDPNFSTVAPPNHPLRSLTTGIISGFGLTCNGDAQPIGSGAASESGECRQDHGDKKPSDIGDEKPEPPAIADDSGNVSAGTSPVTNGAGRGYWSASQALKDQADRAERDAELARQRAERTGDTGVNPDAGDLQDILDDLPAPEDLDDEEHPCQAIVSIRIIDYVSANEGADCLPQAAQFEVYVYNSCESAAAAAAAFQALHTDSAEDGCPRYVLVTRSPGPGACTCETPEGQEPGVIGYKRSGTAGPPALSLIS